MTLIANYRAARRRVAELNSRLVVLTVAAEFAAQHPLSSSVPVRLGMANNRACTHGVTNRQPEQGLNFSAREAHNEQRNHRGMNTDVGEEPAPRTNLAGA